MRCDVVTDVLPGVIDDPSVLDLPARSHLSTCLRCQAEAAQYRRLNRSLRSLRAERMEPADGLLDDIYATIDDPDLLRHAVRSSRRAAYLSGLAAATAAGAAGAIVIASRARSRRFAG